MAAQVRVTSSDIAEVAAAVRKLGDGRTVVTEMAKEIRAAVPPVRKAVRAHAIATLPSRGGLNRWVARAGVRATVKRGPRSAGVKLVAGRNSKGGRADLKRLDRSGRLRHPLPRGNRSRWYLQQVTPGWFSVPVAENVEPFTDAVGQAVDTARRKVGL